MGQNQARPNVASSGNVKQRNNDRFFINGPSPTTLIKQEYYAQTSIETTVKAGDIVIVNKREGEWSFVNVVRSIENMHNEGWIPTNCLESSISDASGDHHSQVHHNNDVITGHFRTLSEDNLYNETWYHGTISRVEAQRLLESGIAGSFLVRESESVPGGYSISLRANDTVYHYRISREGNMFYISPNCKYNNLFDLIEHHRDSADGLVAQLKFPIPKKQNRLSHFDYDQWEINREDIRIQQRVGGGQYGDVYKAFVTSLSLNVAVKTLREDNQVCEDFMKEMEIMKKLQHRHLIKLIGVCSREIPYYLLTEFMTEGCLLDFIRKSDPQKIDSIQQLRFAIQICDAMRYLEEKNFIHRDLAARNCLVTSPNGSNQLIVKVADFGLSRLIETNEIYTAKKGGKFPIKWTAPEAIAYNRFSIKSDIWSFGILFWEICSFGMQPYPGIDISNVYEQLENGKRLDRPDNCSRDCYAVMRSCWEWNEKERKTFYELYDLLQRLLDRYLRENHDFMRAYQPQPPPMSFKNHPSMKQRPISTRPILQDSQMSPQIHSNRPNTALGHSADSSFVRAEPARKSGSGFIKMLKKSFGKGKHKRNRKISEMTSSSSPREISSPREMHAHATKPPDDSHPPDIWLNQSQTGIQKPVPRKPPRRTRSKSGSGSCSSPTPSNSVSSSNLPPITASTHDNNFHLSQLELTSMAHHVGHPSGGHVGISNGQSPSPKHRIHPIGNKDSLSQHFQQFNIKNLTPQVPELTPTNSKENIFECSSETSCDDFASLHSTGNHFNRSKRPNFKPPEAPKISISPKSNLGNETSSSVGFGSLHGGRETPSSIVSDTEQIFQLQRNLYLGLLGRDGVRRSVILQCGQPLCDAFHSQTNYLPASKKFKFSEKLTQMQSELDRLLSNQTNDGNRLATLSTELVNLLR